MILADVIKMSDPIKVVRGSGILGMRQVSGNEDYFLEKIKEAGLIDKMIFSVSLSEVPKVDFGAIDTTGLTFHKADDWYVNLSKMEFGNLTYSGNYRSLVDTGTSFTILP
jgi:hypothetical protein